MHEAEGTRFALCLRNAGYPASLEVRKLYPLLPTTVGEQDHCLVRVIDESGQDYLYPADCFILLELPSEIEAALLQAA
jgi:hypothetical protein